MNYKERAKINILLLETCIEIIKKDFEETEKLSSNVEIAEIYDEIESELNMLSTRANNTAYILGRLTEN